jgi:hypothetical protein
VSRRSASGCGELWEAHDAAEADRPDYQEIIEAARAGCDEEIWEQASAEGRAMSLDEAADYAL